MALHRVLDPRWFTASECMWSWSTPAALPPLAAAAAAAVDVVVAAGGRGVAVGLVTFGVVVVPGRNLGYRGEESGSR